MKTILMQDHEARLEELEARNVQTETDLRKCKLYLDQLKDAYNALLRVAFEGRIQ